MLTSIELFAGGGGMALGLHAAGFAHRQLVEWDSRACDTLRLNGLTVDPTRGTPPWTPENVFEGDVRDYVSALDGRARDVDLVAGGRPASRSVSAGYTQAKRTAGTCFRQRWTWFVRYSHGS